jgi:hypothetical protein
MPKATPSTFRVAFLASPPEEGERTKVRGANVVARICLGNPPPLPFEGRGDRLVGSVYVCCRAYL